ncbi:KAP P-loop protein [Beggiatoa sp. PS]|nr:KAP P-loop protein [Beggiatoa sp. PS]
MLFAEGEKTLKMTQKIKGLKDSPIKVDNYDALGLNDYAEALSDFILFTDTPMTLGIQGDWGSGKSSLMYLIENKIKADSQTQEKNVHTMWFNTWQFSQFNLGDKLSISLLSRFIEELESLTIKKKSQKSGAKEALQWIIAGAVDIVGADQIARKMLEEATFFKTPSENIADLQTQLIELVDMTLTDVDMDRIVVFIDDLDRLIPQKAVELLEALKSFLDIEGCVYVIACDYQIIVQGLKQKFGVGEAELKGRSFFDKIIQVPFKMPVNQYHTEKFCKTMLEHIGVTHTKEDVTLYLELISYSVGFNPRTVKRLFNNLLLLKLVLEKKKALKADKMAQINERMRILFATQCLQNTFVSVYNYLHNYLQKVTKPQTVINEINHLFTEFREPETLRTENKFAKLWQDIKTDDLFFNKLAHFMGTFLAAIQLKSDTSKNADNHLNADEILVLKTIMSFSAVVSVQEQPAQPTAIHPDIDTIRRLHNQLFKSFLTEIENRYKKELKQLSAIMPAGIKKYQPRKTGGLGLFIEMRLKIVPANKEHSFTLALALDAGSPEYAENGEQHIWHYFYDYYIKDFEPWFEKNLRDIFPTAQTEHDDWGYLLYNKQFPSQTQRMELDNSFKQSAFNILDNLLLRLVQLHKEGKL